MSCKIPRGTIYPNAISIKHIKNARVTAFKIEDSTDVIIEFMKYIDDPKYIALVKDNCDPLGGRFIVKDKLLVTTIRISRESLLALEHMSKNL